MLKERKNFRMGNEYGELSEKVEEDIIVHG